MLHRDGALTSKLHKTHGSFHNIVGYDFTAPPQPPRLCQTALLLPAKFQKTIEMEQISGIPHLPEEIVILILSHFEINITPGAGFPKTERAKLRALALLSLANQSFHRVASHQSYPTLYVPYPFENLVELYIRTLVRNPALAQRVKEIRVLGWSNRQRTIQDRQS